MEQEIRLEVQNFDEVIDRLERNGAKLLEENLQDDEYYGNIPLNEALDRSFLLRIRLQKDKALFTFKGATGKQGVYEEYETGIDDPDEMRKSLERSGFVKVIKLRKNRRIYCYKGAEINLDDIDELGKFIEIEIISEKDKSSELESLLKELGIENGKAIRQGYVSLMLARKGSAFAKYAKD